MKNKIDWRFLKSTIIIFIVALVLSIVFVLSGLEFEAVKQNEFNIVRNSLQANHTKYQKLVEDIDLMQLYTQTYSEFKKTGLVGDERRLSWIETLESVNDVLKLPRLSYDLLPQEGFDRPKLKADSNIEINSTPMRLTVNLLHEEDLLALFEGINGKIDNLFTIDSCALSRTGGITSELKTKDENLTANCLMRWVTVNAK